MKQTSSSLLVAAGKSKRLDAIQKKTGLNGGKIAFSTTQNNQKQIASVLTQSAKEALGEAKLEIEERVSQILTAYPPAKANTFFKLKYGVEVHMVNTLALTVVFDILKLDNSKIRHFNLVQHLNINGVIVES